MGTDPPSKPDVRMALLASHVASSRAMLATGEVERKGTAAFDAWQGEAPGLLVSYVYLPPFLEHRARYRYRDWVLDSGAFSAYHLGTVITIGEYIATCQELLGTDPTLTEVFALDVIGDPVGSLRNCEAMWAAGVPAIPCYHHGEPEAVLIEMAKTYPKIALGGAVGLKAAYKLKWAQQCFARVWPTRIHGFGFGSETHILALPWHSVDATNWESGPCRFGNWKRYGKMSIRGSKQNLRAEVEDLLTVEAKARVKWRKEMAILEALAPAPVVRLAVAIQRDTNVIRAERALQVPTVRLATQATPRKGLDV